MMTIYTTPRLNLTPAEERAADAMEWVHDRLWRTLAAPGDDAAVLLVTGRRIGPNPSLAAIALLERVASMTFILDPTDPLRLFMHEEGEGER